MTFYENVTVFEQQRAGRDWPFWITGPAYPCTLCGSLRYERLGDGDVWQCKRCGVLACAPDKIGREREP